MPVSQYRHISDLPDTIAVFPLDGVVLFPGWQLPLNIFEPRYLNMIDDAMAGNRLIGMIQTDGGPRTQPSLVSVGCIGRITSYAETDDGRYLVTLTGICRFRQVAELRCATPYRQVRIGLAAYAADLRPAAVLGLPPRAALDTAFRKYAIGNGIAADWEAVEDAPMETLVNALATGCPFEPAERQALLEAPDLAARCETLIKLFELNSKPEDSQLQ